MMEGAIVDVGFDYAALDEQSRMEVRDAAARIKVRMSRTAADIIEIGQDLIAVKEALPHGAFSRWIESEFGMGEQTARNLMQCAQRFGKTPTVGVLPPAVLYALSAPSTPDEVITEAVERADSGEILTASHKRTSL